MQGVVLEIAAECVCSSIILRRGHHRYCGGNICIVTIKGSLTASSAGRYAILRLLLRLGCGGGDECRFHRNGIDCIKSPATRWRTSDLNIELLLLLLLPPLDGVVRAWPDGARDLERAVAGVAYEARLEEPCGALANIVEVTEATRVELATKGILQIGQDILRSEKSPGLLSRHGKARELKPPLLCTAMAITIASCKLLESHRHIRGCTMWSLGLAYIGR
ncbi:hypothetical protein L7F22_049107 [Adiantum nelumboides]|nr:hypothetical protein [Adiantum nelumboides]